MNSWERKGLHQKWRSKDMSIFRHNHSHRHYRPDNNILGLNEVKLSERNFIVWQCGSRFLVRRNLALSEMA